MSQMWAGVEARAAEVQRVFQRAALAPTLVRVVILLAASASLLLAFPPVIGLQLVVLLPALFPRTLMTSAFILFTFVLWLNSSGINPGTISVWRVSALAMTLYLVHVGSALAAVLPYDSVVTPGVFRPWIVRVALVGALTGAVAMFIFTVQRIVSASSGSVAATVGGFVLLITTAILLAYLGNRRQ